MKIVSEDWQASAIKLLNTGVMSRRQIAKTLKVPRSTALDFMRNYEGFKLESVVENSTVDTSRILIISDMHVPYSVEGMLPFLEGIKHKYNPTFICCIGDELDHHSLAYHDSDPDLYSAGDELKAARKTIKEVENLFPEMTILDSNHGSLAYRKAKTHGVPRHYLKSYNDVLGVGEGWKWVNDLTLTLPSGKNIYFHHGKTADGLKLSQSLGMSCVQGHHHEKFGINYWGNSLDLYFSLQVGCLIDDESYAFAYNNVNLKRPVLGVGLIIDGVPILEAFPK